MSSFWIKAHVVYSNVLYNKYSESRSELHIGSALVFYFGILQTTHF